VGAPNKRPLVYPATHRQRWSSSIPPHVTALGIAALRFVSR